MINRVRRILLLLLLLALPAAAAARDFLYFPTIYGSIMIYLYVGSGNDVVIPESIDGLPVGMIGPNAFHDSRMTSVTIPNTVTTIGNAAFAGCTKLTNIIISSSLTNISYAAFSGCKSLTKITIPNSVTAISYSAFSGCTSLTDISIGNGVIDIKPSALQGCTSLSTITVDALNSAYSSADGVLFNKGQTTLIKYPQKRKVGSYTIPNSVTTIATEAFYGCNNLASVTIPNSTTTIEDSAFASCTSLTGVTIPNSVTSIGDEAFSGCKRFINVTIPNSVLRVGDGAFSGCNSLINVSIGNSVVNICNNAFAGCKRLTSVTIPNSVIYIGEGAFSGISSLQEITVEALNSFYRSVDGILFDKSQTTLIQFPPGNKFLTYTIPHGVTSIGRNAFDGCTDLAGLMIPASVTSVGADACLGCVNLTEAYFRGSAPSIESNGLSRQNVFAAAIAYYVPGTAGWSTTFAGNPTKKWNPEALTIGSGVHARKNNFGFTFTWDSGKGMVIEAASNLANPVWIPLQTNTLSGSLSYFSDPHLPNYLTNYPSRFYRARSP